MSRNAKENVKESHARVWVATTYFSAFKTRKRSHLLYAITQYNKIQNLRRYFVSCFNNKPYYLRWYLINTVYILYIFVCSAAGMHRSLYLALFLLLGLCFRLSAGPSGTQHAWRENTNKQGLPSLLPLPVHPGEFMWDSPIASLRSIVSIAPRCTSQTQRKHTSEMFTRSLHTGLF